MMSQKKIVIPVVILLALILIPVLMYLTGVVFFVEEMESAVVTRFGDIQYAVVTGFDPQSEGKDEQKEKMKERYQDEEVEISFGAGLRFKLPFVERVHYFDSRVLHWDGEIKDISTMDLRTLRIDSAGFIRIRDPIKFYRNIGSQRDAESLITRVINSEIEDRISNTRLIEVVRNENLQLEERVKKRLKKAEEEDEPTAAKIRYGRKELLRRIKGNLKPKLKKRFGIKLVDVLLTQINYTASVRKNVYERMKAERKRIAAKYRGQGERRKRQILGEMERKRNEKLSKADQREKEIMGEAEGKKIKIHAKAFRKNPEFFEFQRALETYRESLNENAVFLLSDDNRLLKYTTSSDIPD